MMKKALILARREFGSALNSPIAYAVVLFFLVFTSVWFFFVQRFFLMDTASLRSYFSVFPIAFTLAVPALTMRSWAEERKLGTAELLLTLPFCEWSLVLGKYLASFAVVLTTIVLTVPVPLTISALGYFDPGAIFGEYVGAVLFGAAAVSVGQFASSLAKNQISAFFIGLVILLTATLANQALVIFELPAFTAYAIESLSLAFHFESFARGVLDTRDIAYFVLVAAFSLFLNVRVLLARKWS